MGQNPPPPWRDGEDSSPSTRTAGRNVEDSTWEGVVNYSDDADDGVALALGAGGMVPVVM